MTSTPNIHLEKAPNSPYPRKEIASLSIDVIGQMWMGFLMHEALAIHRGKHIFKERRTNEDFTALGIPMSEIKEWHTLWRKFPITKQANLTQWEIQDAVPNQHLHFTQILMYERVSHKMGLAKGMLKFITIALTTLGLCMGWCCFGRDEATKLIVPIISFAFSYVLCASTGGYGRIEWWNICIYLLHISMKLSMRRKQRYAIGR